MAKLVMTFRNVAIGWWSYTVQHPGQVFATAYPRSEHEAGHFVKDGPLRDRIR